MVAAKNADFIRFVITDFFVREDVQRSSFGHRAAGWQEPASKHQILKVDQCEEHQQCDDQCEKRDRFSQGEAQNADAEDFAA